MSMHVLPGLGAPLAPEALPRVLGVSTNNALTGGAANNFTTSVTVVPGCTVAVVGIIYFHTSADAVPTGGACTLGGVSGTLIAQTNDANSGDSSQVTTYMFKVVNPPAGTQNLVFSHSLVSNIGYGWGIVYTNASFQEDFNSASNATANLPILANDSLRYSLVIALVHLNNATVSTVVSPLPSNVDVFNNTLSTNRRCAMCYGIEPTAIVNKTYTFTDSAGTPNRCNGTVVLYSKP